MFNLSFEVFVLQVLVQDFWVGGQDRVGFLPLLDEILIVFNNHTLAFGYVTRWLHGSDSPLRDDLSWVPRYNKEGIQVNRAKVSDHGGRLLLGMAEHKHAVPEGWGVLESVVNYFVDTNQVGYVQESSLNPLTHQVALLQTSTVSRDGE